MSEGDRERGLYPKYELYKLPPHSGRYPALVREPFFVLKYRSDPHAVAAVRAYADSCEADYPVLAADLRAAVKDL